MRRIIARVGEGKTENVRDADTGEVFESAAKAAEAVGVATGTMYKHLRGYTLTVKGRRFEYAYLEEIRRQQREGDGWVYLPR